MNIDVIAQNAIKIKVNDGKIIYIDPFKLEDNMEQADYIFITHSHYDHFSPEDILKIKKEDTKIVVTMDLIQKVYELGFDNQDIMQVIPNNEYDFYDLRFRTIPAYNVNKEFHKKEYNWVSYILEIEDKIIYIAGDTDITDEARKVKCDIALVPVGGTFTMNAEEAVELIKCVLPTKYAIPTHYQTLVGSREDAIKFKNMLDGIVEVKILMN